MILVVIILVAWMIILGPNLLKRRARTVGGINSISHFHHSLRVLEQRTPQPFVTPAYRLRAVDGSALPPVGDQGSGMPVTPKLSVVGADQLPRPALAFLGRDPSGGDPGAGAAGAVGVTAVAQGGPVPDPGSIEAGPFGPLGSATPSLLSDPSSRAPEAHARYRARRRRRDTLGVLTMFFASTVLIGFIPGASLAWVVSLVSGLALAAYVALLVRMRQMAEERERKLHYLRPDTRNRGIGGPGVDLLGPGLDTLHGMADMPVRISGRYAHPSNQAAVAR